MKILFRIILILIAITSVNQATAQFRYGPTAGIDITTLKFKQDLVSVDQSLGYQAGVQCEMMFPGIGFGIDFGLMYDQRGATVNLGEKKIWASEGYGKERAYLHYIAIPIDIRFKWTRMNGLEDYVAPYVFGGPVLSIMAAHSSVDAFKYAGGDLGVQAGLGFEIMKRWQVQASYTWGMTYSLKTKLLDNYSARNRTWSVRVTRYF